jgi:cation diffusion facilitator CzcD-associated flavoprotein CzcO/acetyl esterase/lipase
MSSWQARGMSLFIRNTFKRRLAAANDAASARKVLNSGTFFLTPRSVTVTQVSVGGVPGEYLERKGDAGSMVLLYLHGGGYIACSSRSHRAYTSFFARQGFRVFAPDYRLAPEHVFPAAVDDAEAVYLALLADGIDPARLVVAGDSAGGGLCLSLLLRLRQNGIPLPAAGALFSPLTDLALTGETLVTNDQRCAMFCGERIGIGAKAYLAGADPRNPIASPLYAELKGLPPLLIHVGTDETLRDDSTRFAEAARAAGIPVQLRLWDDVPHVWQLFHHLIPEGRASLHEASNFLRQAVVFSEHVVPQNKPPAANPRPDFDVAIIGTGFGGLGMAIKLKQGGNHSFVMLEKADDIGGTWRANTYPGCACDVPSHMYSFSFERNPDWSRMYSTQPEILEYLKRCVDKYGLRPHIRLGTEMREAVFDETNDVWTVRTTDGMAITARIIVSATGALSRPAYPKIPGLERFKGTAFHSSEWNHGADLTGKRVAVIGTGASTIQFLPQIAPRTGHLTLFQRTPAWILPKMDRAIGTLEKQVYRHVPGAMGVFRDAIYWVQEGLGLGFVHPGLMKRAEKMALAHMRKQITDPTLRAKLTPDYMIGCKRILISNDFYPALARPNVELVTSGIAGISEHAIVGANGIEHPVDAIIFGTGFRVTDLPDPLRIIGRGAVDLNDSWSQGAEAYLGVMTAGYPNLFLLLGPNTGLGHHSVVFMVEQQIAYVMKCLRLMRAQGMTSIEVRREAQTKFNQELQRRLQSTVWATGCKSWYQDAHGKNVTLWPGFTFQYWSRMKRLDASHFRLARAGQGTLT